MKTYMTSIFLAAITIVPVISWGQDRLGGSDRGTSVEEIRLEIEQSRKNIAISNEQGPRNTLTPSQQFTLALQNIYRNIRSDATSDVSALRTSISNDERAMIEEELSLAYELAIEQFSSRKSKMCETWSSLRGVNSNAVFASLLEYRREDERVQLVVNDIYAGAYVRLEERLSNETNKMLLQTIATIQERYASASVMNLDDEIARSSDSYSMLASICNNY